MSKWGVGDRARMAASPSLFAYCGHHDQFCATWMVPADLGIELLKRADGAGWSSLVQIVLIWCQERKTLKIERRS